MEFLKRIDISRFLEWYTLPRVIGTLSLIVGLAGAFGGPIPYIFPAFEPFHRKISSELIGIGLTVLIIDVANEKHIEKLERERLIFQMRSKDNDISLQALEELKTRGWLFNGSLQGINLKNAKLQTGVFVDIEIREEDSLLDLSVEIPRRQIRGANLQGVNLTNSSLNSSILVNANLTSSFLEKANLQDANLTGANLEKAICSGAIFQGACLKEANLFRANLGKTNLKHAKLINSILKNANLKESDLQEADFLGSISMLEDADLFGANMRGAINLDNKQLIRVIRLVGAIMPDGKRYDGCFNLKRDIEWAHLNGINTKNPESMSRFYSVSLEEYTRGQAWADMNLQSLLEDSGQIVIK